MKSSKVLPQGRRPHSRIDRKRYEEKDQMTINDNTIIFGHSPDADDAFMYYLRAPQTSGDYTLSAECSGQSDALVVQVRTLQELRQCNRWRPRCTLSRTALTWSSGITRSTTQKPWTRSDCRYPSISASPPLGIPVPME